MEWIWAGLPEQSKNHRERLAFAVIVEVAFNLDDSGEKEAMALRRGLSRRVPQV